MQFANNAGPDNLHCLLTESMDIVVYVNKQRMPRSDCTDAQAHLDLRCSHMAYRFFSHLVHHVAYQIA